MEGVLKHIHCIIVSSKGHAKIGKKWTKFPIPIITAQKLKVHYTLSNFLYLLTYTVKSTLRKMGPTFNMLLKSD